MKEKKTLKYNPIDTLNKYANNDIDFLFKDLNLTKIGLHKKEIALNKIKYGNNKIKNKKEGFLYRLKRAFINPFSIVLFILGLISLFTDIIFASNPNYTTFIITISMVLISGIMRYIQELHSKKLTDDVIKLVSSDAFVLRDGIKVKVEFEDLVVGDQIYLNAGDKVPVDIRIIKANDLFISESIVTGESQIKEKNADKVEKQITKLNDYTNILFQGSNIVSGSCIGVVINVGENTINGNFSIDKINKKHQFNGKSNSIIWVLIKFMLILIPIVFIASGLTKGDWLQAFLFALSVAVGLTPELLPMIITACLGRGSHNMAKKKTIIKNINAMNEFGTMNVLCVDKTGTLTQDKLILEYYMDIIGNESKIALDMAYLNSYFSSGVKNHLDNAILNVKENELSKHYYESLIKDYEKIDEIPFDYDRKINSILLKNKTNKFIICKGNVDDIISRCKFIYYKNKIEPISENKYESVHAITDEMSEDGMKIIAIAFKNIVKNSLTPNDEDSLILLGYLAFFDSPKKSSFQALKKLSDLNIKIKILTGDNKKVTSSIAKRLNFKTDNILRGHDLDSLDDNQRQIMVENCDIFVELSPIQKEEIISILKSNGHTVGFLGDGMNDLKAMGEADVSISVENAAPSLKQSADVVLLKKDLDVLSNGVIEGRKSFINMSKYIKITSSSNFGNILAIVISSIFLPFFPMTSIQLLLLNLFYDALCLIIPFDKVDDELIKNPSSPKESKLAKFMLFFGPISSLFDIVTFAFLFFYICPVACGGSYYHLTLEKQNMFASIFQTGWFLESMWTQILILHLLRTNKLPFVQSKPSLIVSIATIVGIILFTTFAITPLGSILNLTALPWIYFIFLIGVVICYLLAVSIFKKIYIKFNKSLL